MAAHSIFLPGEPHEWYEKAKRYDEPPSQKVFNMLLGKHGGQLLMTSGRMKQLGQSRSDTQLWMCLVVKVNSDAVSENSA